MHWHILAWPISLVNNTHFQALPKEWLQINPAGYYFLWADAIWITASNIHAIFCYYVYFEHTWNLWLFSFHLHAGNQLRTTFNSKCTTDNSSVCIFADRSVYLFTLAPQKQGNTSILSTHAVNVILHMRLWCVITNSSDKIQSCSASTLSHCLPAILCSIARRQCEVVIIINISVW